MSGAKHLRITSLWLLERYRASVVGWLSDKALSTLIRMVPAADGAVLEQLSSALQIAERGDPARFNKLVQSSF